MTGIDEAAALTSGGWDRRYAVVLAVASAERVAAAVVDANGDGNDLNVSHYESSETGWVETASGSAGDRGASWTPTSVAAWGAASPGRQIAIEYLSVRHLISASPSGWWLFVQPTMIDDETLPRILD